MSKLAGCKPDCLRGDFLRVGRGLGNGELGGVPFLSSILDRVTGSSSTILLWRWEVAEAVSNSLSGGSVSIKV